MQEHVRANDLSENPRRLLIGGTRARKILIATPLLQWYLKQGLHVTRIYQVIEYVPGRCFRDFVHEVSTARRQGDEDATMSIIADTQKLIGSCGYGGLIMDQSKHRHVTYVQGTNAASDEVNDPLFIPSSDIKQNASLFGHNLIATCTPLIRKRSCWHISTNALSSVILAL